MDIDKFLCDIRKYRLDDELAGRIQNARSGAAAVSSTLTFLCKAMNYAFEQQGLRYDGNGLVEMGQKEPEIQEDQHADSDAAAGIKAMLDGIDIFEMMAVHEKAVYHPTSSERNAYLEGLNDMLDAIKAKINKL